jgi:hypothetical protein
MGGLNHSVPELDAVERFILVGKSLWFYLSAAVLLVRVVPVPAPQWSLNVTLLNLVPWLAFLAACWFLWRYRQQSLMRHVIFALSFFVANITPIIGFTTMSNWLRSYVQTCIRD